MIEQQRFALVFNGGVSLAVWMGGVAHELNNVRLAHPDTDPDNLSVRNVWGKILSAANTSIAIDLIAGTSAGGLNGAILAQAIANDRDLADADLRNMWMTSGSLTPPTLLNDAPETSAWALDADFFAERVAHLFDAMAPEGRPPDAALPMMTLLTTATAVDAPALSSRDDNGLEYGYHDSRRVYRFHQSPCDGTSNFGDAASLAVAARASASYPVAFQPVEETAALVERRVSAAGAPSQLMDGGVLDNAPFEPLLTELVGIPVGGPWRRHVIYVTPSVQSSTGSPTPVHDWSAELGRVLGVSREPDERLDEQALSKARQSSAYSLSRPHTLLADWLTGKADIPTADGALFDRYQRARTQAALLWIDPSGATTGGLPPGVIPLTNELTSTWDWGVGVAQRIANWWGRALGRAVSPAQEAYDAVGRCQYFLARERRQLDKRLEVAAPGEQLAALEEFYSAERRAEIARELTLASEMVARTFRLPAGTKEHEGTTRVLRQSLTLEVLSTTFAWTGEDDDLPTIHYTRLTPLAAPPFHGRPIRQPKLYGERWGHFGAFASRTGREHDWRWGRLDAAAVLGKLLLGDRWDDHELRRQLITAILREEYPDLDPGAREGKLAEELDAAQAADGYKLFRDMDDESDSTWPGLVSTLAGLISAAPRLNGVAPYLRAALGRRTESDDAIKGWRKLVVRALGWASSRITGGLRTKLRNNQ